MALTTVPASLSATALTLTTAAQPNITSVGTLTGLTVSGNIAGTLTTAAQTNITSLGTLSALTISGDLTVDTNTLKVDSSNSRVGIGTTSPGTRLHIQSPDNTLATDIFKFTSQNAAAGLKFGYQRIEQISATTPITFNTGGSEAMRIDSSGNVGIGTTPDSDVKVHIKGDGARLYVDSADYNLFSIGRRGSSGADLDKAYLRMKNAGTNTVVLDTAGDSYFNGGKLLHGTTTVPTGVLLGNQFVSSSATGSEIIAFREDTSVAVGDKTGAFLLGNSDTDGTEDHFVGMYGKVSSTNGSQNLYFVAGRSGYEGDTPDMTILSGGNVGIGVSPSVKFNVDVGAPSSSDQILGLFQSQTSRQIGFVWDDSQSTLGVATITAHDLVFHTSGNSSEKMRITTGGNVSIGSTHSGFSGWRVLNIRGDSTGGMLNFENSSGTRSFTFANQGSGMRYQAHISGGYHRFETNAASNALYIEDGGDVGIGTGTPDCALEVERSGEARIKAKSTNNNWAGLDLESHSTQSNYIFFRDNSAERARIQVTDGNDIVISNTSSVTPRMRINNNGYVGIGTGIGANPATMLDVESTAADWISRFKNYDSGAYGVSIDLSGSSASDVYAFATYTPAGSGFFVNKRGRVGIGKTTPAAKLHVESTGSATYSGSSAGSNIALYLTNGESGAAGRTVGLAMISESNAEIYLNAVTAPNNNGGDFVIASRNGGTRAEKMRIYAAGSVTKPLNPSFNARYPAVTNGGNATIVFSSTHHNIGSHYNTSTGVFTAPVAGSYLFSFAILMDPSGLGHYARVLFSKNGTSASTTYGDSLESTEYQTTTQEYQSLSMTAVIYMSVNDTMRLQNTGQSPTYGTSYGSFSGYLLG